MTRATEFNVEKARLLRFMRTLEKAQSAAELRAMLMAEIGSPWHSFDPLVLAASIENMGAGLARLLDDDLDTEAVLT